MKLSWVNGCVQRGKFLTIYLIFICHKLHCLAPEGLNVVKTNFTSISVEWQPLPQSNILGTVSGYRIKYAISHSAVYASMDLKSDQTQAIISNLKGNTEYKIKVAGLYNERQEEGPYSDKIDAKTSSKFILKSTVYFEHLV